jgi:hypothetical protein
VVSGSVDGQIRPGRSVSASGEGTIRIYRAKGGRSDGRVVHLRVTGGGGDIGFSVDPATARELASALIEAAGGSGCNRRTG